MSEIFKGLFDTTTSAIISVSDFLLCVSVALVLGGLLAFVYAIKSRYTKSFLITLGILPGVVCIVIMMVNGNVGAGVAVAGAFSLVRFRSAAGTAKEIAVIFLAMAAGLVCGMGYLAYATLFTLIISVILVALQFIKIPQSKSVLKQKTLRITIPEDLDYTGIFNDIFDKYTTEYKLTNVKTSNMGSLFKLTYHLTEKDIAKEKEMIDELRVRNGNLEISLSEQEEIRDAL
ncbi:MAG: DUF4956 domain-containing protein [Clostridiales bacterium]|nr:DUF4956 domain-containing protein [Clostridiales bacterium]